jgi:hemerythrin
MNIHKIDVARGIQWIDIPAADLRILCGCPADAVKHLIKRGLIQQRQLKGVTCETGPNAILLSDLPIQNGEFSNLAEFPVLQMLYKQGLLLPDHPNNTGRKPMLIGSAEQVDAQMRYIYRGNYGLVSCEEMVEAGVPPEQAAELMRLKLAFSFGQIRPTQDFLTHQIIAQAPVEIAPGVTLRRVEPNVFEFSHAGEQVTVDLNLWPEETYECPYPLGYQRFHPAYFSVIHSGEGDGWDVNRPCMSSCITYQGKLYLIDAGPQLGHIMNALGIGVDQIDGLFHTHAHDDHFAGLTVLMRAGRRVNYYASPPVRASVAKKLTALLGIEEERFADFFAVHDLPLDRWTDIDGLEVQPVLSPHPVETNIFLFRTLWGSGWRSYAHLADIASMSVLQGMVSEQPAHPGISQATFERTHAAYLTPVDLKKIDIGGGLIHGDAADFKTDTSQRILLAHRSGELRAAEKEIGSSAAFGTVDTLIEAEGESLRRSAFDYLAAHLPGVPMHQLRMLLSHPIIDINPGTLLLKEGSVPQNVLLLISGQVEKLRTQHHFFGSLSAGAFIGEKAVLGDNPSQHTYHASSFLRALQIPRALFGEVVRRNQLLDHFTRSAELSSFLETTRLLGDGVPVAVFKRILEAARERRFQAGEKIDARELQCLNFIRSGLVKLCIGERVVEVLGTSDVFGEETSLFKVPSLSRLTALEETTVIQIPGDILEDIPVLRLKSLEGHQQRMAHARHHRNAAEDVFWHDTMVIHVARMDRHHQRIFEIAEIILRDLASPETHDFLQDTLATLLDYIRYHFEAEEKMMLAYQYPQTPAHQQQHQHLLTQLETLRAQISAGQIPAPTAFRQFIESTLAAHFREEDSHYASFLNARGVY